MKNNKRREFLKHSAVAVTGTAFAGNLVAACASETSDDQDASQADGASQKSKLTGIEMIPLGYEFSALEPNIDAQTMEIHYTKHYNGYVTKFNKALEGKDVEASDLEELLSGVGSMGEEATALRRNGGGAWNHALYWEVMTPGGAKEPEGDLAEAIKESFGSVEAMKQDFSAAAKGRFGSGWAWLVHHGDGKLAIGSTPNQDNPLMDLSDVEGRPVLGIDVWEHAYYLKYQNERGKYIQNWWNTVNWDVVSEKWQKSMKA